MNRLALAFARDLASRPWLAAANLGVLALGAMVVCSVDHAIVATRAAFGASWSALHGNTTHWLAMPGERPFDERLYVDVLHHLWKDPGLRARIVRVTPIVQGQVLMPDGAAAELLGMDLLTLLPSGPEAEPSGNPRGSPVRSYGALLAAPGAVIMPRALASRLGLERGDAFSVTVPGRVSTVGLRLVGQAEIGARVVLADIATAQEVLQPDLAEGGRLTRIELVVRGAVAPWYWRLLDHLFPGLAAARAAAPLDLHGLALGGLEVTSADQARLASQRLADAFFFNLGALSLLALVVGVFLVVQSTTFNVRRRRPMLARFRALGVSPFELRATLILEAMTLGAIAAALGCLMGVLISGALVDRVAATVSDLFLRGALSDLRADWLLITKAGVLCIAGAGLAGWLAGGGDLAPARLMTPDIEPLRAGGRPRRFAAAALLLGAALALALNDTGALGALLTIASVLLAFALLLTDLLDGLLRGLRRLVTPLGVGIAWIIGDVQRHLLSASSAARALLIAVAASVGMIVMISSFRIGFVAWLETRVAADLYLLAPIDAPFGEAARRWVASLPGVTAVALRGSERTMLAGRRVEIVWGSHGQGDLARYNPPANFDPTHEVLLSEPLARAWNVRAGDLVSVHRTALRIAAVFREYGGQGDVLVMDRDTHDLVMDRDTHDLVDRDTHDPAVEGVGTQDTHDLRAKVEEVIRLANGVRSSSTESTSPMRVMAVRVAADARETIRSTLIGRFPYAGLRTGSEIRSLAVGVFDRTFVVADVLRVVALLVAVIGMLIAFATLQLARRYEMGVARAVGTTRTELLAAAIAEATLLGVFVTLAALPVGTLVAWLLIDLLNARAFGWTFDVHLPLLSLGATAALAVAGSMIAGCTPALQIIRRRPIDDLRMIDV